MKQRIEVIIAAFFFMAIGLIVVCYTEAMMMREEFTDTQVVICMLVGVICALFGLFIYTKRNK